VSVLHLLNVYGAVKGRYVIKHNFSLFVCFSRLFYILFLIFQSSGPKQMFWIHTGPAIRSRSLCRPDIHAYRVQLAASWILHRAECFFTNYASPSPSRNSPPFTDDVGLILWSQEPATGPCPPPGPHMQTELCKYQFGQFSREFSLSNRTQTASGFHSASQPKIIVGPFLWRKVEGKWSWTYTWM
jgi:hypothetical protein